MTPLPILLEDVYLSTGDLFRKVWAKSIHLKYADMLAIVSHENMKLGDNTPE